MGTLNARFQHKRDTSQNWTKADPVLLEGEIIIVDTQNGEKRTKTGDGKKKYTELPFDDEAVKNLVHSKADSSTSFSGVLLKNAWENGSQTISVPNLKVDQNGVIGISQSISDSSLSAVMDAALYVSNQSDGSITISFSGTKPTEDIPFVIILLG